MLMRRVSGNLNILVVELTKAYKVCEFNIFTTHELSNLLLSRGFQLNSFRTYYDSNLMLEFFDSKDEVVFELLGGMETIHNDRRYRFANRQL